MAPFYREEEYHDFMSSLMTISANDGSPTLSATDPVNVSRQANFVALRNTTRGAEMQELLCAGLTAGLHAAKAFHHGAHGYVFKDTSAWTEAIKDEIKPDLAMYPDTIDDALAVLGYSRDMEATARGAWTRMTMPIEAKYTAESSAFHFEEGQGLLRNSRKGREAQTQIAKYVSEIMVHQHRTFVFLLSICQTKARITRWDRAGCIVSKPFDFVEEPGKLLSFVFRLALMSRSELGYDTTAILATEEEVQRLTTIVHVNEYARECAKKILDPETRMIYPIYKVTCKNIDGKGERAYFIGKHSTASYSVTGRGTKGYIMFIVDVKTPRLGFMKDYWRTDSPRAPKELDIHKLLQEEGVAHVATAIGGGDVDGGAQRTVTDRRHDVSGVPSESLGRLVHCRVALSELARPLDIYAHSGELITIVCDALKAHKEAWEKAKVLHGDISVNNIMSVVDQTRAKTERPRGILIDWDFCKHRSELTSSRTTQDTRTGTWAFMSAASLQLPLKPHTLADDLESFIHVITFCSLRYHVHTMTLRGISASSPDSDEVLYSANSANQPLSNYVHQHYDTRIKDPQSGYTVGGEHKMLYARQGELNWDFAAGLVSPALVNLVKRLYELLQKHYKQLNVKMLKAEYSGIPQDPRFLPRSPSTSNRSLSDFFKSLASDVEGEDLNSHARILALFEMAVGELAGWADRDEKTKDQFYGLQEFAFVSPQRSFSGGSNMSVEEGDLDEESQF